MGGKILSLGDLSCWGQDISNAEGSGQNQGNSTQSMAMAFDLITEEWNRYAYFVKQQQTG